MARLMIKAVTMWIFLIPLGVGNGMLREFLLRRFAGVYALPVSGLILMAMILIASSVVIRFLGVRRLRQLVAVGMVWASLTAGCDFAFGRIMGIPFTKLLRAYDPSTGDLWLFIVLLTGCAPVIAGKLRRII